MLAQSVRLAVVVALSGAVVGSVIGFAFLVRRDARRRVRSRGRTHAVELFAVMSRYVRRELDAEELRTTCARAEAGAYWDAVEAFTLKLDPRTRRRLARVLARNPHARDERFTLRDDSPWRAELAARRLGALPSIASRRALRRALARGPEMLTLAAARALGRHRDRAALRWLLAHPSALARRRVPALTGLLRTYGRATLPDLTEALERGVDEPLMARAVIETLGLARHTPARQALERALTVGNLEVRVAAARALGRLEDDATLAALVSALHDEAWPVRAQAALALGRLGAPLAVAPLAAQLTDASWWVRRHSAYALAGIAPAGRDALGEIAASSPDRYAREMAREALDFARERQA